MSEFKFSCPQCGQHILCDEQLSGREIQCPNCQHRPQIPPIPEKSVAGSEQRPPDSWSPPPLPVQPQTPQNERHNLPTGWKVSPVILASLAVVVTGSLLLWSVHGLLQSYSREVAAMRREQSEINAKSQQMWNEHKKQMAQEYARSTELIKQRELRLQQDLEQIQQSRQRLDRQRQLGKEQAELVLRSKQLPRNSSEYRTTINRLQAIRAELGALAKEEAAHVRKMQLTFEISDLEHKLFNLPRKSNEYQATSNQLQALQTQLRQLRGEPAEVSPAEVLASKNGMASSSNQSKELDAFAAAQMATRWGCPVSDGCIHQHLQSLGAAAEQIELPHPVIPPQEPEFSLVIMLDGWMARERGPDWGAGPRKREPQRVLWHEIKSAVIYRLERRAAHDSGRGMLIEKFVVATPPETSPWISERLSKARPGAGEWDEPSMCIW